MTNRLRWFASPEEEMEALRAAWEALVAAEISAQRTYFKDEEAGTLTDAFSFVQKRNAYDAFCAAAKRRDAAQREYDELKAGYVRRMSMTTWKAYQLQRMNGEFDEFESVDLDDFEF